MGKGVFDLSAPSTPPSCVHGSGRLSSIFTFVLSLINRTYPKIIIICTGKTFDRTATRSLTLTDVFVDSGRGSFRFDRRR
jgi:hypothetical protein